MSMDAGELLGRWYGNLEDGQRPRTTIGKTKNENVAN